MKSLKDSLKGLDERLKVIESSPKETLLTEVDTTKKEVLFLVVCAHYYTAHIIHVCTCIMCAVHKVLIVIHVHVS